MGNLWPLPVATLPLSLRCPTGFAPHVAFEDHEHECQAFVSWNQIANWLCRLEAFRQESGAGANLFRNTQS